jgi:flagellar biosynthesis chaperone FliJ
MNKNHDMGFLAHEVQEHYPFLVDGDKDGENNQSVNYNGFIALLVKEIQTLKSDVQTLKNEVNSLKQQQINTNNLKIFKYN